MVAAIAWWSPATSGTPPPGDGAPMRQGAVEITDISEPVSPDRLPIRRGFTRIPAGRDRVALDVYIPPESGRYPAVVLLHGAHPNRGDEYYEDMSEDLARHGFVCLYLHYHDRGRRGKGSQTDWMNSVEAALDHASAMDEVDPSRLGLLGFSSGAFLALNYAPTDDRVIAVAAFYGGLSPGSVPKASKQMPPTLLLHGTWDRTVSVKRSVETFESLRLSRKPVSMVIYPKAGHGFTLHTRGGLDEEVSKDSWKRTLSFLDFHLKMVAWTPELPEPQFPPSPEGGAESPSREPFVEMPQFEFPYLERYLEDDGEPAEFVLINPTNSDVLSSAPPPRGSMKKGRHHHGRVKAKGKAAASKKSSVTKKGEGSKKSSKGTKMKKGGGTKKAAGGSKEKNKN